MTTIHHQLLIKRACSASVRGPCARWWNFQVVGQTDATRTRGGRCYRTWSAWSRRV